MPADSASHPGGDPVGEAGIQSRFNTWTPACAGGFEREDVMPAKAGIQSRFNTWTPACAGGFEREDVMPAKAGIQSRGNPGPPLARG